MRSRSVAKRRVTRIDVDGPGARIDQLAVEEPLEIRVDGTTRTTTMRTPGDDFDLALGWCLTEGIISHAEDAEAIRYCPGKDHAGRQTYNVVEVSTRSGTTAGAPRLTHTTSACGLCGAAAIDEVRRRAESVAADDVRAPVAVLRALPDRMRAEQEVFDRTGGLHAAGVFTAAGDPVCVREDVGRHNAVDKVVGWAAGAGALPLAGHVLFVSGRVAFEIVAKALVAGTPVVAAVSAPTGLAAELADEAGLTLVGFVRGSTMNVYTHPGRVIGGS